MPTTATYALPTPAGADAPDVPYWTKRLADAIDALVPKRLAFGLQGDQAKAPTLTLPGGNQTPMDPTWLVVQGGLVVGQGAFTFTTGQAAVASRDISSACIPIAARAKTDRGPMMFVTVGNLGSYYGPIRHDINPYSGAWRMYRADVANMSWAGNDQRISLAGISWDIS